MEAKLKAIYQINDAFFFNNNAQKIVTTRIQDRKQVYLEKINKEGLLSYYGSYYFDIIKQISTKQHDNVVNVLGIYEDQSQYIYIAIEKCSNNLLHYLNNNYEEFNSQQIDEFIKQIIKGYQWLIEQKVLHRNLKPENIYYIKNGQDILFKIGGFEHSKILDDRDQPIDEHTTKYDDNYYQAPELNKNDYSFKADIFSLGLILLQMAKAKRNQNELVNRNQLKQMNLQDLQKLCRFDNLNLKQQQLLSQMIVYHPENRISWSLLIKNFFYEIKFKNKRYEKAVSLEDKQSCFIKIIEKQVKDSLYYLEINKLQELEINRLLKEVNHPNIVKIYEVLHEPECSEIYIIMEDCDGDLNELLERKQFKSQDIFDLALQINNGYKFLEDKNIIHRDIKPDNILFKIIDNKIQYKIADFGISRISDQGSTKCGTQLYIAPEVKGNCQYTNKCDIFSLGIVLYYMATNKQYPFKDKKVHEFHNLLRQNKSIEHCYQSNLLLDNKIQSLINKMIVYEPKDRVSWGSQMDELIQSIKNNSSPKKPQQQPPFINTSPITQIDTNNTNPIYTSNNQGNVQFASAFQNQNYRHCTQNSNSNRNLFHSHSCIINPNPKLKAKLNHKSMPKQIPIKLQL